MVEVSVKKSVRTQFSQLLKKILSKKNDHLVQVAVGLSQKEMKSNAPFLSR